MSEDVRPHDPALEEISDRMRKGIPVGLYEGIIACEYQEMLKEWDREHPTTFRRIIRFFTRK